jgi:acetyl esterase/lipase
MRYVLLALIFPAFVASAAEPILLWPKGAPGEKGVVGEEQSVTSQETPPVTRIANVTKPTLTLFLPPREKSNGTAVIVCPGGGYGKLAWNKEGTEVCGWLNSIGVTAFALKYRVPKRAGDDTHRLPLQDAQRALSLVRHRAAEWGIDPQRIGIMGFSAGGHLSAAVSTNHNKRSYEPADDADRASCRPDFALLIYPAYLVPKGSEQVASDLPVNASTPPTFLAQTEDDNVRVECSLFYYLALKNVKVPAEMHLYPNGGHGYGLRPSDKLISTWPKRAADWLRSLGLLERKKP